jgi:hypothetical protein
MLNWFWFRLFLFLVLFFLQSLLLYFLLESSQTTLMWVWDVRDAAGVLALWDSALFFDVGHAYQWFGDNWFILWCSICNCTWFLWISDGSCCFHNGNDAWLLMLSSGKARFLNLLIWRQHRWWILIKIRTNPTGGSSVSTFGGFIISFMEHFSRSWNINSLKLLDWRFLRNLIFEWRWWCGGRFIQWYELIFLYTHDRQSFRSTPSYAKTVASEPLCTSTSRFNIFPLWHYIAIRIQKLILKVFKPLDLHLIHLFILALNIIMIRLRNRKHRWSGCLIELYWMLPT